MARKTQTVACMYLHRLSLLLLGTSHPQRSISNLWSDTRLTFLLCVCLIICRLGSVCDITLLEELSHWILRVVNILDVDQLEQNQTWNFLYVNASICMDSEW